MCNPSNNSGYKVIENNPYYEVESRDKPNYVEDESLLDWHKSMMIDKFDSIKCPNCGNRIRVK